MAIKIKVKKPVKDIKEKDSDVYSEKEVEKEIEETGEDWFAVGDAKDSTDFKTAMPKDSFRMWGLKPNDEKDITILSDKPLTFREHTIKFSAKNYGQETCLDRTKEKCPLCEAGNKSYVAKAFWVLEHFSDDKGKKVSLVKYAVFKTQSYEPLKKLVSKYFDSPEFSYAGLKVTIMRTNSRKAPSMGDMFLILGVDKDAVYKHKKDATLDKLKSFFKPKKRVDLLEILPAMYSDDEEEE